MLQEGWCVCASVNTLRNKPSLDKDFLFFFFPRLISNHLSYGHGCVSNLLRKDIAIHVT